MSRYTPQQTLAHGAGMILLDEVLDWSDEHASCALTVQPHSHFCEPDSGVPAWVGVEYMAQTIGVYAGIRRLEAGRAVEIGLLLGTRAYECAVSHFPVGTRLMLRAELLVRDSSGVGVFRCSLGNEHTIWAQSEIKAFQPDDLQGYLQYLAAETP